MANDEKMKLLDEATKLLADIALNQSGMVTDAQAQRAVDFVTKAKHAGVKHEPVLSLAA